MEALRETLYQIIKKAFDFIPKIRIVMYFSINSLTRITGADDE